MIRQVGYLVTAVIGIGCTAAALADIEVHGHRGARAARPENTLPAFRYALDAGVDVLELDLHVTKDDELVIMHDHHVSKTLCRAEDGDPPKTETPVRALTLKEVKSYDCGSVRHPRFPEQKTVPGTSVPTLGELFSLVKKRESEGNRKRPVKFNIETKTVPGHPEYAPPAATFSKLVIEAIKKAGFEDRVILQSFDHRTLIEAKKRDADIAVAPLVYGSYLNLANYAQSLGAEFYSPHQEWIDQSGVEALQEVDVQVVPWTANTPEKWSRLIDFGVDGIITDAPAQLIKYLEQRGLRKRRKAKEGSPKAG